MPDSLHDSFPMSPPMERLEEMAISVSPAVLGSPEPVHHKQSPSISLEIPKGGDSLLPGSGRRWHVDIVGDNSGTVDEEKAYQLCFTGAAASALHRLLQRKL